MGLLKKNSFRNITHAIDNVTEITKEVVVDRDKAIELNQEINKIRTELMLSGAGASITKITICGLISLIVGIGAYVFLQTPEHMEEFKDFASAVTPLIAVLTGVFGAGSAFKHSKFSKD